MESFKEFCLENSILSEASNVGAGKIKEFSTLGTGIVNHIKANGEFEFQVSESNPKKVFTGTLDKTDSFIKNLISAIEKYVSDSSGENLSNLETALGKEKSWKEKIPVKVTKIYKNNDPKEVLEVGKITHVTATHFVKNEVMGGKSTIKPVIGGTPKAEYYEAGIVVAGNMFNGMSESDAVKNGEVKEDFWEQWGPIILEPSKTIVQQLSQQTPWGKSKVWKHYGSGNAQVNTKLGYSNGTPKTDLYIAGSPEHRFSLKMEGGSQLMSGLKPDSVGVFNSAYNILASSDKFSSEMANEIAKTIEENFTSYSTKSGGGAGKVNSALDDWFTKKRMGELMPVIGKMQSIRIKPRKTAKDYETLHLFKSSSTVKIPYMDKSGRNKIAVIDKNFGDAVLKHIKSEGNAAGIVSTTAKDYFISDFLKAKSVHPDDEKQFMSMVSNIPEINYKQYMDVIGTQGNISKNLADDIKNVLEMTVMHKSLKETLQNKLENAEELKKWAVYEASSGVCKFSTEVNPEDLSVEFVQKQIVNAQSSDAMASQILVFSSDHKSKGKVQELYKITPPWAQKKSQHVKVEVGIKSSSGSLSSSFRLLNHKAEDMFNKSLLNELDIEVEKTLLEKDLDNIISEEWKKLNPEFLNEGLRSFVSKSLKKTKDILKGFYDKVLVRIIDKIKEYAKKGINFLMNALGLSVSGKVQIGTFI